MLQPIMICAPDYAEMFFWAKCAGWRQFDVELSRDGAMEDHNVVSRHSARRGGTGHQPMADKMKEVERGLPVGAASETKRRHS